MSLITKINIVGPGGEQAVINESSLDAYERNGWKRAPEGKTGVSGTRTRAPQAKTTKASGRKGRSAARDDSAETLDT
jgi:hypothetical protein